MSPKVRFLRFTHIIFLLFVGIEFFLPNQITRDPLSGYAIGFASLIEIITLIICAVSKDRQKVDMAADLGTFLFIILIGWQLMTAKFNLVKPILFPPVGIIVNQFIEDLPQIGVNILSSLSIIVEGYILGLLAIPVGFIALLPTFRSVSVLVIFLATFWPVFMGTISGVKNVDSRLLNSAKVLNLSRLSTMIHVILPASLSQIFVGANLGLCISFILLTSAEMIGARAGLGFYVKNYSDLGDYTRTLVGIVVIGVVVVISTWIVGSIQNRMLKWKS